MAQIPEPRVVQEVGQGARGSLPAVRGQHPATPGQELLAEVGAQEAGAAVDQDGLHGGEPIV